MDDENTTLTEEDARSISEALVEKEGMLVALSDDIDMIVSQNEKTYDEECAKLDTWFDAESANASEERQETLQSEYRQRLMELGTHAKSSAREQLSALASKTIQADMV